MVKINLNKVMTLKPGQLISIAVDTRFMLRIDCGLVWLTIEGDEFDYWLATGDTLLLPAGRHIVLEAEKSLSHIAFTSCLREEPDTTPTAVDTNAALA